LALTKARLSAMAVMTTAVGYVLARPGTIEWATLGWTVLGTALAAGSASALNQVIEVKRDARMRRTADRPIPSGAMSAAHAFIAGIVMGYAGILLLALQVNLAAAGIALLTIVLYVLVYTPMKARSTLNTLAGAVCGALPPLVGYAAGGGGLDARAIVLPGILFVWQIPHFMALAWLHREDYARGGFRMLPLLDPTGRITAQAAVLTSLMVIPLCLLATLLGVAGLWFATGATAAGLWLAMRAGQFWARRSDSNARRLFVASIIHLPILLTLLVLDAGPLH